MLRVVVTCVVLAVASGLATVVAGGPAIADAELSYVGSSTIGEHVIPEAAKAFTARTGVRFGRVELQGSGKGFDLVSRGEAPLGGVSRALTPTERRAGLYYRIIGYDAVTIAVHRDNTVGSLTLAQLRDIFTGKVTSWRDVGGAHAPIVLITMIWGAGRAQMVEFQDHVLGGAAFRKDRTEVDTQRDQVATLAAARHGITAVSTAFLQPGVKVLTVDGYTPEPPHVRSGAYVLSRPLVLIAARRPEPDVRRFIDFVLSAEGQAIVARRFVTTQ